MTTLQPGLVGGRYRLGERLGSGGMADVHRAHDELLRRDVAVKLLRNPADPTHRARFASEASTLAGLRHPHLVTLLDAGLAEDIPFLTMDLIEGQTLAQLAATGPLSPEQARDIGAQVARGLAHAHARGVVHRDVKPSNILIDRAGTAYLTDFGIARLLGVIDGHTRADELVGSPAFLAPEQVEAGELTPAADVYSLGLVLLEVLTGRRAYPGSPVEAAIARLRVAPLIPTSLGPTLSTLLQRMTRLDPASRPTAEEVATVLEGRSPFEPTGAAAAETTGAVPVVVDVPALADAPLTTVLEAPSRRPVARRRLALGFAGASAAAAVLAALTGPALFASSPQVVEPAAPAAAPTQAPTVTKAATSGATTTPVAHRDPQPRPAAKKPAAKAPKAAKAAPSAKKGKAAKGRGSR